MNRLPLIQYGSKVLFYADEFVCKCGKCRYSDPELIPEIMSLELKEHLTEYRIATGIPTVITRGVSCLEHHKNIYKNIYGNLWKNYITWDSAHVPDKEKKIHGGQCEIFYGVDTIPQTDDFLNVYGHYCFFRFMGVIWYKKHYIKTNKIQNSFIHIDNHPIRTKAHFKETIYDKY
jgi:hypothetical protein